MRHRYNLSFRREQQKKERIRRIIIFAIVLFVFAVLGTLIYFAWNGIDWSSLKNSADKKTATEPKKPETVDITINSVGEVTIYNSQITAARTDDGHDFSGSFENIKKYINEGDLSLFSLETTFGGEPYQGYPRFNSPDELATNMKDAGFTVAVTANEHALDSGIEGVSRTLETLDNAGLQASGTRMNPDDKDYLITTVEGIKVGVIAYTEETSYSAENRTLDGRLMSDEESALINSYSTNALDVDLEKIEASIDNAKEDGAKIIICYFNWGDDYDGEVNDTEKEIAETLANMGVDIIFATHPHIVQEIDTIKSSDNRDVPVFYSLGNFLSGQRYETVGNRRVEQGIIARVNLTYDTTSSKITKMDHGFIPTWTDKFWDNEIGSNVFSIVPLTGDLERSPILEKSGHLDKAKQALSDLEEKLGDPLETKN